MYTLIDNLGNEEEHNNLSDLENFLAQPFEYWKKGTGDSAIQIKDEERLIFFKVEKGVFIMQHPDYLIPLKEKDSSSDSSVLIQYVGGEEFKFPERAVYNEKIAFEILKNYIENKKLDKSFNWVDLYSIIEYDF